MCRWSSARTARCGAMRRSWSGRGGTEVGRLAHDRSKRPFEDRYDERRSIFRSGETTYGAAGPPSPLAGEGAERSEAGEGASGFKRRSPLTRLARAIASALATLSLTGRGDRARDCVQAELSNGS